MVFDKQNNKLKRMSVCDAQGRTQHLLQGMQSFTPLRTQGEGVLLLGLGADVAEAARHFDGVDVLWLDAPAMLAQRDGLTAGWRELLPAHFTQVVLPQTPLAMPEAAPVAAATPDVAHDVPPDAAPDAATLRTWRAVLAEAVEGRQVWLYAQNMRLFPAFWGAVWGILQAHLWGCARPVAEPPVTPWVLLGGDSHSLLHQELALALEAVGYGVRRPEAVSPAEVGWQAVGRILREGRPQFFLSVNMQGLDAQGLCAALLHACEVPVVLWFVDNPWHILSGVRQDWWKRCHICVTDASFVPALRAAGGARVRHLPLAAGQHMAQGVLMLGADAPAVALGDVPAGTAPVPATAGIAPLTFVGRSSFPAHDKFFAAARVAPELLAEALRLLGQGGRPDFAWWASRLNVRLWPDAAVRCAGLGAETCAQAQRVAWLKAAASCGVRIFGDAAWQTLVPELPAGSVRGMVDYYGSLPRIYAASPLTLNVTSLLLPAGLTQRHFDVWAAGGFLLTNITAGLDIFPQELVREVAVPAPGRLPLYVQRFEREAGLKAEVRRAWAGCIAAGHQYVHRIQTILGGLEEK